ncbi:S8 family serine peptidase [Pseudogulbenkiania subflava]|uniref:Serine protease AprX n=1 Tax=Pseudogulbenkiania subflava DSM 22618 TaxID=1123014 RepID=A0A1Y6BA12_9NEIS|nr:S8 family serine peptidase [Pseudogulbenkiania subflava]SME92738.1 serine protease AprX [Pseudogulbenkiania subflava DSM 22618]
MRRAIVIGSLTLVLLSSFCAAVTPGAAASQPVAPAAAAQGQLTDRNGVGISDGLQIRLAQAQPEDRFDVVVTFREHSHAAAARQTLGNFVPRREFKIIPGFAGRLSAAQIRALSHAPGLVRIEEDAKVHTQLNAARPDFGVDAARGLAVGGVTGRGVGICVVDTGVDPNHEQLDNGKVAGFIDYVNSKTTPYDDQGHGTHVSSIAAGDGVGPSGAVADRYQGVAPGAALYVAKVLNSSGSGAESNVVAGIEWCASQAGVHVISMSLAATPPADGNDAMSQAVNAAVKPPVGSSNTPKVVTVAAGNDGDEPGTVGSPGAAAEAMTVAACAEWSAALGAANHSDGVYLTAFSSRGPITDSNNKVLRIKPDICAPGHTITAAQAGTASGYVTYSGTSMATPFVAGSVALALEANAALKGNPTQVRSLLEGTAQDRGTPGKDNEWGAGVLDAYAFVARAQNPSSTVATLFPGTTHVDSSVGDNVVKSYSFYVSDTNKPIGAIVTITSGGPVCIQKLFNFCFAYAWLPDLDARLIAPDGTVLSESLCMGGGLNTGYGMSDECASPNPPLVALGRQETLHAMPATPGQYRVEVWGAQDSVNQGKGGSFSVDLSQGPLTGVVVPPDFALTTLPASLSVVSGTGTSYTTTVTPAGGFSGPVNLSASGLPAGAGASLSPNPITGGAGSSTLSVTTSSTTPAGSYPLTVTGTSGSLSHGSSVTLVVSVPNADFSLSASPPSRTVKRGGRTTYTTTVGALNGFNGAVTLSATGLPSGATFSFSPNPVAGAGSSTMTVWTKKTTPLSGTAPYKLMIEGKSGSLTHSTMVDLIVK